MGDNGKKRESMLNSIFASVTQCRIANESEVVSDLAALMQETSCSRIANGYLKDVSPEDANLLDGVNKFSLRSMICPGEPEVNYVFAGDSSLALVDVVDGQPSTRRNIGEYLKKSEAKCFPAPTRLFGRGLPDIIKGVESSLEMLKRRGTSRPAVVVISYGGNDIFGQYGFIHCEWIEGERAAYIPRKAERRRTPCSTTESILTSVR
eukprot:s1156_g46.t1